MKIGIHRSTGFYPYWIDYCEANCLSYKLVNAYDNDIMEQLADCDCFMWHPHHKNYKDALFAKELLYAVTLSGRKVFPDFHTIWHFDDKVGQKYLFEAIQVPVVPTYVFYTKKEALAWVEKTSFPKVFKLRNGAGSSNVKRIENSLEAKKLINKAFGKGFSQLDKKEYLKEKVRKFREGKETVLGIVKGIGRYFIPSEFTKMHSEEKGYIYFQDFIPDNDSDIRVIVIGDKAFGIKRFIRENDFRASGSGHIHYKRTEIPESCIKTAFEVTRKIRSQCAAYDFVFDADNNPLLIEVSYGFSPHGYVACEGYWDENMRWYEGTFDPYGWMIENLVNSART